MPKQPRPDAFVNWLDPDIKRFLAAKPKGVRGLAVAGMPIGSPGMEVPGVTGDRYPVMAFGKVKSFVYARH